MNWIDRVDCKALRAMTQHSSAMYIVSRPNGEILWANNAFLEWSKYTLFELTSMSWKQISVQGDDLRADEGELSRLNGYDASYSVQKQYIPKNSAPVIGNLTVTRYPIDGDIEFCWCRWEAFVNGTAKAFESAMHSQKEMTQAMQELTAGVKKLNDRTEEEQTFAAVVKMIKKYPKVAWSALVFLVLSFAGSNAASILQRFGFLGPEQVTVVEGGKK